MRKITLTLVFTSIVAINAAFLAIPVSAQEQGAQEKPESQEKKSTLVILQDFSQISKKFESDSGTVRLISLLSPT